MSNSISDDDVDSTRFTEDTEDTDSDHGVFDDSPIEDISSRRPPLVIPPLPINGIPVHSGERGSDEPGCAANSMKIELLSQAFVFEQNTTLAITDGRGAAMQEIIGAAFEKALSVPRHQLKYYRLIEITSPTNFQTNNHIGVSVQTSDLSLDAIEDMLKHQKDQQQRIESGRRRIGEYEDKIASLETELREKDERIDYQDEEISRLLAENERLSLLLSQQPLGVSQVSGSPRLVSPGPSQTRVESAMIKLQRATAENAQIATDLHRQCIEVNSRHFIEANR